MNFLTQLAGMVIGFVTVMLATSLVVSVLVRIVHYLGDKRSKTLGEMLGALIHAFRVEHGDHALVGDTEQTTFVLDVLTYPTLHLSSDLNVSTTKGTRYLDVQAQRQALAKRVEYVTEENLIEIVTRLTRVESKGGAPEDAPLPARWYARIEPDPPTLSDLESFIRTWYKTVEDVGTQSFAVASRQLTAVLSCIVVVLLCLDGIQLGVDLYKAPASLTDHLAVQGDTLLRSPLQAEAIHPSGKTDAERDPNLGAVEQSLIQSNSVLNEPGLHLGWQSSWLVKEVALFKRNDPSAPSGWMLGLDSLRWLLGIVLSCLLISLGAPFWADQLTALLNLRNATAPPKKNPNASPPEAPPAEA